MIDFRYHIVSLVAVFLALGIGVVMGTTVIDRAIVTRLEGDIGRLQHKVRAESVARSDAQTQLKQMEDFTDQGAKFFVGNRLVNQTVNVVTIAGVDQGLVDRVVQTLRLGGASVPATIQINDKFLLKEQTSRDQLALYTGAPNTEPDTLRAYASANLAYKLGSAKLSGAEQAYVTPDVQDSLLSQLSDDGFVSIAGQDVQQGLDPNSLGGSNTLAVVIGAEDVVRPVLDDFFIPLTFKMASGGRSLAAEGTVKNPTFINAIRANPEIANLMSTVDNIETRVGCYVAVVALEQMLGGVYEQLGTAKSAQAVIPQRVAS